MRPLASFTDEQLLEELIRRRNARTVATPKHWCHDCRNFVAWDEVRRKGEMPDDFNPCTKGHEMKFIVPQEIGDEHGFYLSVCADRDMGDASQ